MYEVQFIRHRQAFYPSSETGTDPFVNVSSYGNNFFDHLRKSFNRIIDEMNT